MRVDTNLGIRPHLKHAAAVSFRGGDQRGLGIDSQHVHAKRREPARQPALAAAGIEHALRRVPRDGVDDGLIGHAPAAFDVLAAHGGGPRRGVALPGGADVSFGVVVGRWRVHPGFPWA
jgi:hypothetical protein